jgi:hypothetical protein
MPAGIDEIYRSLRFDRDEVNFSKWPKLSCSAANELTLATPPTQDDPNPGVARLAIAGELKLQAGVAVNELSSDEKLSNNSDLAIPTQKAVKTYVDHQIAVVNQTLSTKAALNGASSQDFQSKNLSVSGNLTANGNVSIGTTSSSYKLAIAAGDINIDDGRALRQAGRWVIGGDSKILSIGSSNKSDGRDISFDPGFSGALTVKKDTGNVGIGTIEPLNSLHVARSAHLNAIFDRTDTQDHLTAVVGSDGSGLRFSNSNFFFIGTQPYSERNNNSAGTELLRITSAGNVGIGTTNPTNKLHVIGTGPVTIENAGEADILFKDTSSGQQWQVGTNSTGWYVWDNDYRLVVKKGSGNVGIGTVNPEAKLHVNGDLKLNGRLIQSSPSDIRLKTKVTQLTNVLEKLEKIRGVSFEWNEFYESLGRSTGHKEIGVTAQEVEAVFPELVTTWGDEDYKAVDYGRLAGVLIEAAKELKAENEALKQRIEALERAIEKK